MKKSFFPCLLPLLFFLSSSSLVDSTLSQASASAAARSPFSAAMDSLQKQIGYRFQAVDLLRRAVTHPSYSRDNYRSLSILGLDAVRAAVSLRCLQRDPDVSPGDLSRRISADTDGEPCAADGLRLGLQGVVRVSPGTNASAPAVLCGAFRAILGAVALDSGKVDSCGDVFKRVHGRRFGRGAAAA